PWHTVVMLLCIFVSLAAILKAFLDTCLINGVNPAFGFLLFAALTVGVLAQYIVTLQYTATAAFAAAGGSSLLLTAWEDQSEKRRTASTVVASILLLLSIGLRADSFLVALPMLFGFGLVNALQAHRFRLLVPMLVVLAATLAISVINEGLYRINEPNWSSFRAYYTLRCELLDYNNTDLMQRVATQSLGWPEPLVKLVRDWFMLDGHMGYTGLKELIDTVNAAKAQPSVYSVVKSTASILRRYPMFALNFVGFSVMGVWAAVHLLRRKRWWETLRIVGLGLFIILYIAYFYGVRDRLPERAAFAAACPGYCLLSLACIPCLWGDRREGDGTGAARLPRRYAALGITGLITACAVATMLLYGGTLLPLRWQRDGQAERQAASQVIYNYVTAHPETTYVTDAPQRYSPLYTGPFTAQNLVDWGQAMYGSDMFRSKLLANGFESMDTATFFDDGVRLILTPEHMRLLLAYLEETDAEVKAETVVENQGMTVYRLYRGV
ncbi:MAG: hypothetical protein PHY64_09985, partial [Eubacteriales bacterium]|nr:hypothetical protein [Eubacteriales bacterium]